MNVASLELSKELYELSGWGDTHRCYRLMTAGEGKEWRCIDILPNVAGDVPAFDLGYLLRKISKEGLTVLLRYNRDLGGRAGMKQWDDKWCTGTFTMPQGDYPIADNPEDAVAKLAIELFKSGVLTRDGDE